MKDPLSTYLTPYDILEIGINANNDEILQAYRKALILKKYPIQEIANAKQCLLDAESRLKNEFFMYEQEEEKDIKLENVNKKKTTLLDDIKFDRIDKYDNIDMEIMEEYEND